MHTIDEAVADDAAGIAAIYNHYIENTSVSFEEEPVDAAEMGRRIQQVQASGCSWLVARDEGRVVGYAYSSLWNVRAAYRNSVEVSVYLDAQNGGQGLGTRLYEALFTSLRAVGVHVVIGGIALPNPASVALHEKFGMAKVAHFSEVGYKFGQWIDVGYWQLKLDD